MDETTAKEIYENSRVELLQERIPQETRGLLRMIQEYAEVQKSGWAKVAELAQKVYERSPHNSRWTLAAQGYWPIILPGQREWLLYIKMESGKIVNGLNIQAPPNNIDILQLANSPEKLDTKKIVEDLERILERKS